VHSLPSSQQLLGALIQDPEQGSRHLCATAWVQPIPGMRLCHPCGSSAATGDLIYCVVCRNHAIGGKAGRAWATSCEVGRIQVPKESVALGLCVTGRCTHPQGSTAVAREYRAMEGLFESTCSRGSLVNIAERIMWLATMSDVYLLV
jgi:hypothetical protein